VKNQVQAKYFSPFFRYFIKRVREILPKDVQYAVDDFMIRDEPFTQCDISVLIGISGVFTGRSVMGMDTRVALELAEMLSGQPIDSFEKDAQSVISELMNIIVGNAVSELGLTMDQIKFTPPMLFYSRAVKTRISESGFTLMRQITTGWGSIEFNLSLEQSI